ncbi:MAG: DUF4906 domain-containing protein [Bacteroidales bacterium]|nr:DUF4906 domain-containing protein [Bacteroidales bacterium]
MVASLLAASCFREEQPAETEAPGIEKNESALSFYIEEPGYNPDAKSVITAPGFESTIHDVLILVVGSDGQWKRTYSADGGTGLKDLIILADGVTSYSIYAFVNMGDVSLPVDAGGHVFPEAFAYTLPDRFGSLETSGLPMCGRYELSASAITPGGKSSVTIQLRRLLSKVVVRVNKSGMLSGASDGSALQGGSLKVRQVSKVLRPFAADADRRAQVASEVYTADTDYHTFTVGESGMVTSDVVLYVAENRQGTGSGTTQADKTPASGREGLATYLKYTAAKIGSSDGVSGDMTYRVYLGENNTDDFNVIGDKVYDATLSLTWNGLFYEGDWRVTSDDLNDARALVISAAAGSSVEMVSSNSKAGSQKVRKATPTAFYMNFFPNGTSGSVAHSRKDMSSWPYGWVAYVDGSSVHMSGTSGTIKNAGNQDLIAWSYNSADDCLSMEAVAGAPASADIHTLQFKTMDGRKSSNVVYFTTSIPFEFRWRADGEPNHVAQRGILEALDADTHTVDPEAKFSLVDDSYYSSKLRLTDNGDGTAVVELIDAIPCQVIHPVGLPEEYVKPEVISIKDADGDRECKVPLEARVPWFECTDLAPATNYIDAPGLMTFTYLMADASGYKTPSKMKVVNNGLGADVTAVCAGSNLDLKLVNELIAPEMTSTAGRLYFDRDIRDANADGSFTIFTHVHTYEGVAALITSAKEFNVDSGTLFISGHKSDRNQHNCTFRSYNPWYFWYQAGENVHSGGVMNDYTLYHEPNGRRGTAKTGWEPNPQTPPTETASYSAAIPNAIVNRPENLKLNASFQEDGGYLGYKVATGQPNVVSPDFTPTTKYRLVATVANMANYDWRTLGNYLWYEKGHYLAGVVWRNPTATDAELKNEVDRTFDDQSGKLFLSGWESSEALAWINAPDGVTASTPDNISGVHFAVESKTITSTWTLTYSMAGLKDGDIVTHNAGKIDVVMQVVNPYNSDSPTLDQNVATAYVRLHLYVWPAVYNISRTEPWHDNTGSGWTYSAFPYCYTEGKTIKGLRDFWSKQTLIPATETWTSASTTILKGTAAGTGQISTSLSARGSATWQWYNNDVFNSNSTDSQRKAQMLSIMSDVNTSMPFTFRSRNDISRNEWAGRSDRNYDNSWNDQMISQSYRGLNSVLGADTYYRPSEQVLYYDPSGSAYTYTYPGENKSSTDKLFVFHLAHQVYSLNKCYYFDSSFGF